MASRSAVDTATPVVSRIPLPDGEPGFNLARDPWIPMSNNKLASLSDVFSPAFAGVHMAGSPVEKIAVLKLLLAIAHAAVLPRDDDHWCTLGPTGLTAAVLSYLAQHQSAFTLDGPAPFLQMPVSGAEVASWSQLNPQFASGNTTILTQWQASRTPSTAQAAMLLVALGPFALGGKKTDNSIVLTPGYAGKKNDKGKPSSGRAGPAVAFKGLLHSFFWSHDVPGTVWLNMLTAQDIDQVKHVFPEGLGVVPWDAMPIGEDCSVARSLRGSIMGRLVPLSRFCQLHADGMHYSEGLAHPSYLDGVADPSVAIDTTAKKPRALWVDPERRPWRELPALLSLLNQQSPGGLRSFGLDRSLSRVGNQAHLDEFAVWSGGMRVSSNAGEQYFSISDDMIESCLWLDRDTFGQSWYEKFAVEMQQLDALARKLYGAVKRYQSFLSQANDKQVDRATRQFWQACEQNAQALIEACSASAPVEDIDRCRRTFANNFREIYDRACPNVSARQMTAWARAKPDISSYQYHWSPAAIARRMGSTTPPAHSPEVSNVS